MTLWSLILLIPGSTWQMQENFSQTAAASDSHFTHGAETPPIYLPSNALDLSVKWPVIPQGCGVVTQKETFNYWFNYFSLLYVWSDLWCVAFEWITAPVCSDCRCFCLVSQILETVFCLTPFRWTCQMLHIALSADELYLSLFQFRWEPLPLCVHESQASLVSSACYL